MQLGSTLGSLTCSLQLTPLCVQNYFGCTKGWLNAYSWQELRSLTIICRAKYSHLSQVQDQLLVVGQWSVVRVQQARVGRQSQQYKNFLLQHSSRRRSFHHPHRHHCASQSLHKNQFLKKRHAKLVQLHELERF